MSKHMYTIDSQVDQDQSFSNQHDEHESKDPKHPTEPLSGSKKVKNRNHSRNNHGEGS